MRTNQSTRNRNRRGGFTLIETLISLTILALVFGTAVAAYIQAGQRAEWSGYSLAAQALATRPLEELHAALWDTQSTPVLDTTTNIPTTVGAILELPISGTNAVWATNFVTVSNITLTNSTAQIKMITVNTVWPYNGQWFTNTVVTYRCPDQ
jgi:prepilin-type N-terminal cleavage/methylation domain-containing protein